MKSKIIRCMALFLVLLLSLSAFSGCADKAKTVLQGTAPNDILTFKDNRGNKEIIRIGMQYYTPDNHLIAALQEEFPDYLFVLDYSLGAGTNSGLRLLDMLENGAPIDLVISGRSNYTKTELEHYVDLSAERFLDNYLLSALNQVSVDDEICIVPGASTLTGIAYNTEMFAENGWSVPKDIEEFYALCETIKEAGISPISNCFKYASQINTTFGTMCYDRLFMSAEDTAWAEDVQTGKASYSEHMAPFFEEAKRYYDAGLSTVDDFSASLTKQRKEFWEGQHAMIFYNSSIFTYAESEDAPFAVGIMPFPAKDAVNSGFSITPEYYLSIPKTVEKNPKRLQLMKDILAFISTEKGQKAMLTGSLNVSNVKGIELSDNPAYHYMAEAYERGNLYLAIEYPLADFDLLGLQAESIKMIFEGASVAEALAAMDEKIQTALVEGTPEPDDETLAVAQDDFTVLETSLYMADKLKEAVGADIGLMVNGGYFRSNLSYFTAGDIHADLQQFVMKGVGADDFLTVYQLSGAQIKALLEHPIINGEEIDALIAASGLAIEYAPWNERGSRVRKLTLADGAELLDDALYTVAAWAGVIDEKYITETVQAYEDLGSITDVMQAALKKDASIKPDIAARVTLIWPEAGA